MVCVALGTKGVIDADSGFPDDQHPLILENGNIVIVVKKLIGDISRNVKVSSFDASLALMYSVGIRNIIREFFDGNIGLFLDISDVTRNGEVTSMDAVRILQFVVGNIPGLPFQEN